MTTFGTSCAALAVASTDSVEGPLEGNATIRKSSNIATPSMVVTKDFPLEIPSQIIITSSFDSSSFDFSFDSTFPISKVSAAKTQVDPEASVRAVLMHAGKSALCGLQVVPPSGSVQLSAGAAEKTQVAPEASVRAVLMHVAESALCALQVVPESGSVQLSDVAAAKTHCAP